MTPANAIEAVTHPDPSQYYDYIATRPPTWDDSLGMWVVSRAPDVAMVLGHPAARVRPPDAPVPPALAGTGAGDVFGRLVRMHDRDERAAVKDVLVASLASLADDRVAVAVRSSASQLARIDDRSGSFVNRWITDVPLGAVAVLAGIDGADTSVAVEAGRDVAACFGAVPPADAGDRADRAIRVLRGLVASAARHGDGLAAALQAGLATDRDDEALANTIGLLFQTADATAGLCANTLVRLAQAPWPRSPDLAAVVADVAMHDPPVHSTRRWFAAPATIDGVTIGAGATVLVVLAAANRDRHREPGESFSFGAGAHRCPASTLAPRIAALTIGELLDEWPGVLGALRVSGCRLLPNARIPTFG